MVSEDYKDYMLELERLEYRTREESIARVAADNAAALAIHKTAWHDTQAQAYRTSVAQLQDSRVMAEEFQLQSQDFLIASGQRTQSQVAAYAASGAMVTGSAMERMDVTRERGAEGAARLRERADITTMRGELQARMTRQGVVEPMFVPAVLPESLVDPDSPEGKRAFKKRWKTTGAPTFSQFPGRVGGDEPKKSFDDDATSRTTDGGDYGGGLSGSSGGQDETDADFYDNWSNTTNLSEDKPPTNKKPTLPPSSGSFSYGIPSADDWRGTY